MAGRIFRRKLLYFQALYSSELCNTQFCQKKVLVTNVNFFFIVTEDINLCLNRKDTHMYIHSVYIETKYFVLCIVTLYIYENIIYRSRNGKQQFFIV